MADPDAMMNSWLGINRFGLVFTKHLFGQAAFSSCDLPCAYCDFYCG